MSRRGGLAGSAAVMFAGTLTSRVLGLVRSALLIAAIYSLGGAADAFAVANKIPNIIYMLIAGGVLNAVLVPQIVRAMRTSDGGQEYVNRLLTLAGTVLAVVTVLLTMAAPLLVTLYAAEFRSGPWASVAVAFAMWCLPQLFFYGMYTLLGQVLNARSVFGPYMWAPAVNNLFAIIGLIVYLVIFGSFDPANPDPASAFTAGRVALLAGSATLGVAAQAAILVIPLARAGFKFRFTWGLRGSGLGRAGRVAWWAFLALLAGQVGYLAISNLAAAASTAAEQAGTYAAGNAAWDNAFLVFMLPQSLITVSLVTALFTRLSGNAAAGDRHLVRDDLSMGLRTLGVFTVFAAGAVAVLAIPVVQVVQFDVANFEAYRAVGAVLVALAMGLPPIAIWTMTQRVYFAYEDTRALFFFQVPMALIQIVGCVLAYLLLPPGWWVVGSAVANSLSLLLGALVSYLALRRKLRSLDGARVLRTYLRLTLAIIPTAGVGWGLLTLWGVQTNFAGSLLRVVVLGLLMGLIYLILLRRLGVSELDNLLARVAVLADPLFRRLAPMTARIPGTARVRTIWGRITGSAHDGRAQGMHAPDERTLAVGEVVAGRYRLLAPAGSDDRWLGADTILDRQVHITAITGDQREAALDAARRAALISDDRLIRILRVGSHDGLGFIVTDVLAGQTLADLVTAGRLHPDQVRTLIGEAAGALEIARRRGVHHLRLHPQTLHRTPSGQVVVTGLAVDAAVAQVGSDNARAAARQDTVHLVALAYTALTGYWPGAVDLAGSLPMAPRRHGAPVPPGELVDGVPEDLDTLCAVTFGPHQDGPFTPGELVRDLAPWPDPGTGPIHRDPPPAAPSPDAPSPDMATPGAQVPPAGHAPQQAWPVPTDQAGAASVDHAGHGAGAGHDAAAPGTLAHGAGAATALGPAAAGGVAGAAGTVGAAGAEGAVGAAGASHAPAPPLDTSHWAPHHPPQGRRLPTFDEVITPSAQYPPAQVLDTYVARHERAMFDAEPLATAPPAGSGAFAVRQPGEAPTDLPPTVDPPPGTALPQGQVGSAHVSGSAQVGESAQVRGSVPAHGSAATAGSAGAALGAQNAAGPPGTAGAAGAAGTAGAAAGTAGAGGAAAGGAASGTAGGAGGAASGAPSGAAAGARSGLGALRTVSAKASELARRAGSAAKDLTGSWRQGPDEEDSTMAAGSAGAGPATASGSPSPDAPSSDGEEVYPEYIAHPTVPAGTEPPDDETGDLTWEDGDEADHDRFNPTPVVILSMIAAVAVAGVLALSTLQDTSYDPETEPAAPVTTTEEDEDAAGDEDAEDEDAAAAENGEDSDEDAEEEAEEEFEGPDPVIDDVRSLDDNPDLAYLAIDGNPDTIWRSLRYNDPAYGMKDGLGFVVDLEETAFVDRVILDVQGEGGTVQIRADDPDNPDQGPVLAEGAMGPEVTYEFTEPVETDVIVLWFPELPEADSDGRNRIELAGVNVRGPGD